ncbi:DUF58 domain-containing protein [Streptomyces hoynatensis]|uniref:DUF58 domain-containing protein n=1 Tax=Streptomyces hoynatensis TaxID=1141874 RepID=A0A3A9Z4J3_9ACTN|nr:DUF58 domain-containing protein [Streptomyces hoynatensis]RKN42296.1 DUF58 domain-containing protein [Streptomyces hoynatensis]
MAVPEAGGTAGDDRGPLRAAFGGLTTRGRSFVAAGAAAGGCAYALGQPDLLRVGVLLMVLPVACVLVLHRTHSRVAAWRRLTPATIAAGTEARVTLLVENVTRLPSGLLLLQDRVPYVLGSRPRFMLDRVEPGGRREVSYRVRSELRGRYPMGPLQVRLADPFGMVEISRSFGGQDLLTVLPRIETLPPVGLGGEAGGHGEGGQRTVALAGEDDVIPREYRHGDDLRRVHWRATAHRGALMVRREEQPLRARCTVLLDTRRTGYLGAGPESAFERAVSGAASAVLHLAQRGYQVTLLTDTGLLVPGSEAEITDGTEVVALIMDALAVIDHSSVTTLAPSPRALRAVEGALLLAFLGAVDATQAAALAPLRQRAGAAVAFPAAGQADPGLESYQRRGLRAAGWVARGLRPGAGLPRAWEEAAQDLAAHGRRAW